MSRHRQRLRRISQSVKCRDLLDSEFLPINLAESIAQHPIDSLRGHARLIAHRRYAEQLSPVLQQIEAVMLEETALCD